MALLSWIVGPLEVFCYVYYDEDSKEAVIIDPGDFDNQITSSIEKLGLNIKYILATHAHPDHILGVDKFREIYRAPFLMHKEDYKFFQKPENYITFKLWGFPEIPKASSLFEDGELIKIGKKILKVIHTPGHSPGSVCFWEEEEGILFTGDTLFVQGIGRADLPGGNYKLMMESIRKRLLILPEETKIYPGHDYGPKPTSTIEEELKFNPFLQEF